MQSITYGNVTIKEMVDIIKNQPEGCKIIVGTDSQERDKKERLVRVVTVWNVGYGGFFFYDIIWLPIFKSLRNKIFTEISYSINLAMELSKFQEIDDIEIHVDIGENGPTKEFMKEIYGWIHGIGFKCSIKPYSFAASSIADKFSK